MAHGQPDYAATTSKTTVYGLSDMAELAARLGSIHTFDRRGDIIFLDSFEGGLACWNTGTSGSGASVTQSAVSARNGGFSAKLTAGSTVSMYARIIRFLPIPALTRIGIEFSFTVESNITYIIATLQIYDGVQGHQVAIRIDQDNDKIQYSDSDNNYQDLVTGLDLYRSDHLFHTVKFVIDYEDDEYIRFLVNDSEDSMADIALYTFASTMSPFSRLQLDVYGASGKNAYSYIDDVIITQNEP